MTALLTDTKFGVEFLDQVVEWIAANLDPDDVFSREELEDWADGLGFVREAVPERRRSDE